MIVGHLRIGLQQLKQRQIDKTSNPCILSPMLTVLIVFESFVPRRCDFGGIPK